MTKVNALPYILIVDDDPDARRLMEKTVGKRLPEYHVRSARNVPDSLALIGQFGLPSLAMVDLHMPGQNGFEFCRKTGDMGHMPIIMITAEDNGETAGKAISQYVEDYIRKPFDASELAARARRVLNRYANSQATPLPAALDLFRQTLHIGGKQIRLTRTEVKVLNILINAERPVSKEDLLTGVWGESTIEKEGSDKVYLVIHRLRQKIEQDPNIPVFLRTVRLANCVAYCWQP